jgi:hypothetical protein
MKRSIRHIWIEAEEWAPGEWTPANDNTDVIVTLDDGTRWVATFFSYSNIESLIEKNRRTGECLGGKYFWASDMVLADEISRNRIEEVTSYLVEKSSSEFESIFKRIETEQTDSKGRGEDG